MGYVAETTKSWTEQSIMGDISGFCVCMLDVAFVIVHIAVPVQRVK